MLARAAPRGVNARRLGLKLSFPPFQVTDKQAEDLDVLRHAPVGDSQGAKLIVLTTVQGCNLGLELTLAVRGRPLRHRGWVGRGSFPEAREQLRDPIDCRA
jgi:hypothetical protein